MSSIFFSSPLKREGFSPIFLEAEMWTCCGGAAGAKGAAGAGGVAEASAWTCAVRPKMACIMAAKPAVISADKLKEVGMPPAGVSATLGLNAFKSLSLEQGGGQRAAGENDQN